MAREKILKSIALVLMYGHDPVLVNKLFSKEELEDVKETAAAICDIYSRDPDIVSIYYNAQHRLKNGLFKNAIEEEALNVLFQTAKQFIARMEKAVKNKIM